MKKLFTLLIIAVLALAAQYSLAETGAPAEAPADERERTPGPMVVMTGDFIFSVMEPKGWTGDTEKAPKMSAVAVFFREKETLERNSGLIVLSVSRKVDENTAEDLAHDMKEYRTLYPDVEFLPLKAAHPRYKTYGKLFAIRNSSYQYVSYVNPGKDVPFLFIVTMDARKKKAGSADLETYKEIVRSLEFLEMQNQQQQ